MTNIVVHIGAHRTGTSTLQKFLEKNHSGLLELGIQSAFPPYTREISVDSIRLELPKVLISEENMLGTMENNLWKQSLYPGATKQLSRYADLLQQADLIFLSVRNYVDYWSSVIAFVAKSQGEVPKQSELDKIVTSSRGWLEVVKDVRSVAVKAEIVVREFEWKTGNPKQQLVRATKWSELRSTHAVKAVHNARPSTQSLASALLEHKAGNNAGQSQWANPFEPFSKSQIHTFDERYQSDIHKLARTEGIRFLGSEAEVEKSIEARKLKKKPVTQNRSTDSPQVCLLHIGKTGGTYLKSLVEHAPKENPNLFVGKHGDTLISTAASYGWERKLAFLFRHPSTRFVSGFNSRMRQGRPTYNVNWSPAEAAAFSFFSTPNQLAEALFSDDEREKSAAHFAFTSIVHLKLNYSHYLHSNEMLDKEIERGNIAVCCETKNLDKHRDRVLAALGLRTPKDTAFQRHAHPEPEDDPLTNLAHENLKRFWHKEYQIYAACRQIATHLSFTG